MNSKRFSLFIATLFVAVTIAGFLATPAPASAAPPLNINFQPAASAVPNGYIADIGEPYGARNGETYGWITEGSVGGVAVTADLTGTTRERNNAGNILLDTIVHMEHPRADLYPAGAWEIAVINGSYDVTVSVGDEPSNPAGYDSTHRLTVEGTLAINNFVGSAAVEYSQQTVTVNVTDGRLTVHSIGGTNTKINYINIAPSPDGDNDGVIDANDACPTVYGLGTDGCPVDSDNDGFFDSVDSCVNTPGIAPDGCPAVPPADADGDGWSDAGDACPTVPGVAPDGCPRSVASSPMFTDGRVNPTNSALIAAVYRESNGINIYCVDDNSNGFFAMRIDQSTIAGFPSQPAQNTLISSSSGCAVNFYILTSGEFQINIGPDAGGNVSEMIFDGLNMANLQSRSYIDASGGNIMVGQGVATATSTSAIVPLNNCRVTTLDILNFRQGPEALSNVMTMIPYDFTVEAINRTGDRFNVIFGDDNGWITADSQFVTTDGNCG